jgi:hypothetical protein
MASGRHDDEYGAPRGGSTAVGGTAESWASCDDDEDRNRGGRRPNFTAARRCIWPSAWDRPASPNVTAYGG